MAKKRKAKKRGGKCGVFFCFHGAFTSQAKAIARAREKNGFVKGYWPHGQSKKRWVVMSNEESAPF
jgi:hypothetical protein